LRGQKRQGKSGFGERASASQSALSSALMKRRAAAAAEGVEGSERKSKMYQRRIGCVALKEGRKGAEGSAGFNIARASSEFLI